MTRKIAINGFGRIGRLVFRQVMELPNVEVVAINDVSDLDNLLYLLRYDSIQQRPDVEIRPGENGFYWGDHHVRFLSMRDPAELPWKELGIDIVVEASGRFVDREGAGKHLMAGASHVIISAPAKKPDITVCMGLTHENIDPQQHRIISNASCTTNCLAPIAKLLNDAFGIEHGLLTTVHAVTSSQNVVDGPSKKWRRGRSALLNIVPTSTGAAKATGEVLPELKGKLDGMAMRVPVADGSVVDLVIHTSRDVTLDEVKALFKDAATKAPYDRLIQASEEELVSSDIIGTRFSAVVDLNSTMTIGSRMVKVIAWYDNEWGYSRRIAELADYLGSRL